MTFLRVERTLSTARLRKRCPVSLSLVPTSRTRLRDGNWGRTEPFPAIRLAPLHRMNGEMRPTALVSFRLRFHHYPDKVHNFHGSRMRHFGCPKCPLRTAKKQ